MKKINIACLMILGLLLTVSCDSDRDSNPTLTIPDSFVLNEPIYINNDLDLKNVTSLELATSQPDYGFTAAVTYAVQISFDDTWIDGTEDEPGSCRTLGTTFTTAKMDVDASEIARNLVDLGGWVEESQIPDEATAVYVRLRASLAANEYPVYSNSVKLSIIPYFIKLVDALPLPYYLIGSCIGDGKWTNTNVGESIIPLGLVDGYAYDKITGQGEFVYTGYFPAGEGFKLIGTVGSWDIQWGNADVAGIDNPIHNEGGSKDFAVPADGWYIVKLNTTTNTLTFEATTDKAESFATMELVGDFNNWANDGVEPLVMTKSGGEYSHVWYATVTFDADGGCKFRTDSSWSNNWGGVGFPYGMTGGDNISVTAGTYLVVFNDLDGSYYFFEQK